MTENFIVRRQRKGWWKTPEPHNQIRIYDNLVELLRTGTTDDIIFSCFMNNVVGFKLDCGKHITGWKYIQKVFHAAKTCKEYRSEKSKKTLIKKLMKL
jgi:hypothetical protein